VKKFKSSSSILNDPVCGLKVAVSSPFRVVHHGQKYFFCSQNCEAEFREDPNRFVGARPEYFQCPRHPGIRQAEPDKCPECGTALEAVKSKWVCPYHPEILHDEPGVCPVYGLPLIPEPPGRFYSCERHPKVKQLSPGKCPHCRITLQPRWAPVVWVRTEWFCTLHPEIVRTSPGHCPECGMKLEPRQMPVEKPKRWRRP
jgi:Cu+-exporting ATPase